MVLGITKEHVIANFPTTGTMRPTLVIFLAQTLQTAKALALLRERVLVPTPTAGTTTLRLVT